MHKPIITLLALALAGALGGCASYEPVPLEDAERVRISKPLGGETLAEKHREMQRTQDDLVRHLKTLDSMNLRGDSSGIVLFKDHVTNHEGTLVYSVEKRVLIARRPA